MRKVDLHICHKKADAALCRVIDGIERYFVPLAEGNLDAVPKDVGILHRIRNPFTGREIPIGIEGARGFTEAASILVEIYPHLKGRTSTSDIVPALKMAFSEICLRQEQRVDPDIAGRVLKAAKRYIGHDILKNVDVFVPCRFIANENLDPFSIGWVTFLPTKMFEDGALNTARARDDPILQDLEQYCSDFSWIAKVRLRNCTTSVSEEKARMAVLLSLDILKLIFPRHVSAFFLQSGGLRFDKKPYIMSLDHRHKSVIKFGLQGEERYLEAVSVREVFQTWKEFLATSGSLIKQVITLDDLMNIYSRLTEAIKWFGEAVTDLSEASSIVRYGIALEVLLLTRDKSRKNQIVDRASLLCAGGKAKERDNWRARVGNMYATRGRIVHGNIDRQSPPLHEQRINAHEVVRRSLVYGMYWMCKMANEDQNMSPQVLDRRFKHGLEEFMRDAFQETHDGRSSS